jgi:hypothetical protein
MKGAGATLRITRISNNGYSGWVINGMFTERV